MRIRKLILYSGLAAVLASAYISISSVSAERKYRELERAAMKKADVNGKGFPDIQETRDWYKRMGINPDAIFKAREFRETHPDFRYPTRQDLERYLAN